MAGNLSVNSHSSVSWTDSTIFSVAGFRVGDPSDETPRRAVRHVGGDRRGDHPGGPRCRGMEGGPGRPAGQRAVPWAGEHATAAGTFRQGRRASATPAGPRTDGLRTLPGSLTARVLGTIAAGRLHTPHDAISRMPRNRSKTGQSGSGKTTLMRCVNLLEIPERAEMEVAGEKIFSGDQMLCKDLAKLRQTVGMVFQRFNLFPHLTAVENIMLAQLRAGVPEEEAMERAIGLLRRVRLAHRGMAYPDKMSGGEQQRVAIARALALQPAVLLFDEPTSALDPESTGEVLRVMRELARDGMTMVLVTHEVPFARDVADWVVFVDGGHIVEEGKPAEVLGRPSHERTQAFLANFQASH